MGVTAISAAILKGAGVLHTTETRPILLTAAMLALRALCTGYDDARREVQGEVCGVVSGVIGAAVGESNVEGPVAAAGEGVVPSLSLQSAALSLGAVLSTKREDFKVFFFQRGALVNAVVRYLRCALSAPAHTPAEDASRGLAREACTLLHRVLTDDDLSVQAGKAFEFAMLATGKKNEQARGGRGGVAVTSSVSASSGMISSSRLSEAASTGLPQPPSEAGGVSSGDSTCASEMQGDARDFETSRESPLIPLLLASVTRHSNHM